MNQRGRRNPEQDLRDEIRNPREDWGWRWLERLLIDARLAARIWSRSPGFSTVAILTMAIGIGASTAIFGQINAVFWKRLPVEQPDRLRFLSWTSPRRTFVLGTNVMQGPRVNGLDTFGTFSYPAYTAMRDNSRAFSNLACWAYLGEGRPLVLGELGFASVEFVSGNFFETVGVRAAVGRTIQRDDDQLGAYAPVAMISHRFWQRVFGGDPGVTSETIRLNGRTFSVIGVMPEGFVGMDPLVSPDAMIPITAAQIAAATTDPLRNVGLWNPCRVVGRLAPGISEEQARMDVERWIHEAIAAAPPAEPYDPPRLWLTDASHGLSTLRDATSAPLIIVFTVVGGLLLAACANIAGLLLARGSARQKEIATRLALGASRGRVIRQLITESLVLSSVGGLVGLALAYTLSSAGRTLLSQFMPTLFSANRAVDISSSPDWRVLAFGLSAAVFSGLFFGMLPAFRATRVDLMAIIKQTAPVSARRLSMTGGQAMVLAQTALAVLLLVGAGLFLRTVSNLRATDLGFNADRLLYARVEPRSGALPPDRRAQFFEDAVKRLQTLPGVIAVAGASSPPLGGNISVGIGSEAAQVCTPEQIEKALPPTPVDTNSVTPRYFETLGISFVAGNDFTWTDQSSRPQPCIVNDAYAHAMFPGRDPIGQEVVVAANCGKPIARVPIIGVVRDARSGMRAEAKPMIYWSLRGSGSPVTLIVKTAGDPSSMISSVRRAVTELNTNIPTFGETTVGDLRERNLRQEHLLSNLLLLFATVTVLVCCLGIYGLLSYSVARRRAEISIRMAIGARSPDVISMVVRESLVPVAGGIVLGCAIAIAVNRWVQSLLFGVSSSDPVTLVGASLLFLIVAALAAALPAHAASRVDPVLALRQ
jgi:predicted permease